MQEDGLNLSTRMGNSGDAGRKKLIIIYIHHIYNVTFKLASQATSTSIFFTTVHTAAATSCHNHSRKSHGHDNKPRMCMKLVIHTTRSVAVIFSADDEACKSSVGFSVMWCRTKLGRVVARAADSIKLLYVSYKCVSQSLP